MPEGEAAGGTGRVELNEGEKNAAKRATKEELYITWMGANRALMRVRLVAGAAHSLASEGSKTFTSLASDVWRWPPPDSNIREPRSNRSART